MADLISIIQAAWSWVGLDPEEVVGENDFGNLIVKDVNGRYWRLCPEDFSCKVVAENREELDVLSNDQDFLRDWEMTALVQSATCALGSLDPGTKFYFRLPGALEFNYDVSNIRIIALTELVAISGDIAHQIKDVPDGSEVRVQVAD